jgi:hypothetical protein
MPPTIIQAELWTRPPDPGLIVVTANNTLTNRGRLVMGSGAAKQALDRIPDLDKEAGKAIQETEKKRYPYGFVLVRAPDEENKITGIGLLQTKHYWQDEAELTLVAYSLHLLKLYAWARADWNIRLNYPGIGCGKLKPEQVRPLLEELPQKITVVYQTWEK